MNFISKYKKYLLYVLFLVVILIVQFYSFSILTTGDFEFKHYINDINNSNSTNLMYYNQELTQEFVAEADNLYKIKIYLNGIQNYDGLEVPYEGLYFDIGIFDENDKLIEEHSFDKTFLNSDGSFNFEFDTLENSFGKKYYLKIKSYHPTTFSYLRLEKNSDENTSSNRMWVGKRLLDSHMLIASVYKVEENSDILFYILTFIIVLIFTALYILFVKKKIPIERQYFIISIVVCFFMIFLTSPLAGLDEVDHWARVYEIGDGNFISDTKDDWLYAEIPDSNIYFEKYIEVPDILNSDERSYNVGMQYSGVYSPVSYIPQVIGLKIAQIFLPNSFYWIYFVRMIQALFCVFCTYFAIKIIPFGKKIVFVIAMLPTYIQAISFISADALLFSSSLVLIAKILELTNSRKKINFIDYVLLFVISCVLALSKLIYIPLCFVLLYLIFKRKETKIPILIILFFICIFVVLWNVIAMNNLMITQGRNTTYYLKDILFNPFQFIQIFLYSFVNQIGNHINDLFGGMNNPIGNVIYDSSIIPLLFLALYTYFLDEHVFEVSRKEKCLLWFIIVVTVLLISFSIYISCTPVNFDFIIGIQGRYFLPFLLPIYLLLPKKNSKKKFDLSVMITLLYLIYFSKYILNYF